MGGKKNRNARNPDSTATKSAKEVNKKSNNTKSHDLTNKDSAKHELFPKKINQNLQKKFNQPAKQTQESKERKIPESTGAIPKVFTRKRDKPDKVPKAMEKKSPVYSNEDLVVKCDIVTSLLLPRNNPKIQEKFNHTAKQTAETKLFKIPEAIRCTLPETCPSTCFKHEKTLDKEIDKEPQDVTLKNKVKYEVTKSQLFPIYNQSILKCTSESAKEAADRKFFNNSELAPTVGAQQHISISNLLAQNGKVHSLTDEQKQYLNRVLHSCIDVNDQRRNEALQDLEYNTEIRQLLPFICIFIGERIKCYVTTGDLGQIIYIMHIVQSLLDNKAVQLKPYQRLLIAPLLTSVVCKTLRTAQCLGLSSFNHCMLRDLAARIIGDLFTNYNSSANMLKCRVIQMVRKAFEVTSLCTMYEAILAFTQFRNDNINTSIIPSFLSIPAFLESLLSAPNGKYLDLATSNRIINLIEKVCPEEDLPDF